MEIRQHSWYDINTFKMTSWIPCLRSESDTPEKPNQVRTSGRGMGTIKSLICDTLSGQQEAYLPITVVEWR